VALVLALPLLWASLGDEMEAYMPARLRNRVRAAYETIRKLEPEVNPVKKILCVVPGFEAEVYNDEMDLDGGNDGAQQAGPGRNDANFRALYAQHTAMRREFQELRAELQQHHARKARSHDQLNNTIRRITIQPARRIANNNNNDDAAAENEVGHATLSCTPRDLHSLWHVRVWDRG
jgi:hypothetical protein